MKKFSKVNVNSTERTELHDVLNLTGAEISINTLPAGAGVPFVHSHIQNEEIYYVIRGEGYAVLDDERVSLSQGDWISVKPEVKRQFFASEKNAISYVCIQVKENSLEGYTMTDAIV